MSPEITSNPPQPQRTDSIPITSADSSVTEQLPVPLSTPIAMPDRDTVEQVGGTITTEMEIRAPPVPMVHLRVLVISGQYHIFSFEPETTVGRVKELIWSMWPSEWTSPAQPPSPSFLRVLFSGRILQDDSTLGSNNLPAALAPAVPTVIHLSVRSFSIRGEDDPKKPSLLRGVSATRTPRNPAGGQEDDSVGGCKCVIM